MVSAGSPWWNNVSPPRTWRRVASASTERTSLLSRLPSTVQSIGQSLPRRGWGCDAVDWAAMFWKRRDKRAGLPDDWREILERRSAQWRLLDEAERDRLGELTDWLLTERRWEAARGLELTDEVRTTVAAHACLLILGLDERWYDEVGAIVVRDGSMAGRVGSGGVKGAVTQYDIDGEAQHGNGPVMVSWRAARREAANLRLGRDVVLHEFAHKLDMLDGTLDGTPSLPDQAALDRWVAVCTRHYDDVVKGRSGRLLRSYAATNATEFFSVATESFFTRSLEMAEEKPDLYEVFAGFFRQDPAARHRRALAAAEAAAAAAAADRVAPASGIPILVGIPQPVRPRVIVRTSRPPTPPSAS